VVSWFVWFGDLAVAAALVTFGRGGGERGVVAVMDGEETTSSSKAAAPATIRLVNFVSEEQARLPSPTLSELLAFLQNRMGAKT
jgi:hypothetical protein